MPEPSPTPAPAPTPAPSEAPAVAALAPKVSTVAPEDQAPAEIVPAETLVGKAAPEEAAPKDAEGVEPIKYTDFKFPEGVELDPAGLKEFTDIVGPAQVPQDVAQAIVDMYVKNLQAIQADTQKGMTDAWVQTRNAWTDEVKADKEIGGANLPKVTATIVKALDEFGAPGVREALTLTGADNNPAVVKTLYNLAKRVTEGPFISGGAQQTDIASMTPAQRLYGPDGPRQGMALPVTPTKEQ